MRKFAHPILAAVAGTIAVNALVFGISSGASVGPVSGVLYRDLNNNGRHEAGEPGVPDVVVASEQRSTVTDERGEWSLLAEDGERLTVQTGWYRSQCDTLTCKAGPGPDQDFKVQYQKITTKVQDGKRQFDVGLLPDWKGGYPIPSKRPIPANRKDISVRVSFVKATAGESNCNRTGTVAQRACQDGDRPTFLVQIYNEGTRPIWKPRGHLELPPGTRMLSFIPSPLTHPSLGEAFHGEMDDATRRVPFTVLGMLPPGGMGIYELSIVVEPDAPITSKLQTKGSFPNPVGARITSVKHDTEDHRCLNNSLDCPWGSTDRQRWPDNSDTTGFAVVAATAPRLVEVAPTPVTTTPRLTEAAPTPVTTAPVTTAPATTAPATTAPATTAPATTAPATTAPVTTAPATTAPPTTAPPTTTPPTTTPPPTTAPPTTAPPASSGCTVSDKLVPSCGVWLGTSTPSKYSGGGVSQGLAEYEAVAQNTPDILHFYKTGAAKFPSSTEIAMAERPGKQRSLLLYNWKPSKSITWRQIANGGADADIATVAANLKKYPHKLFLNIYHEPEDNVKTASSSGMTPDDYADMYRHVVTELRGHGVTNAVYVWNVMGYSGWQDYLDALYPGKNYVDWMCYDPYARDNARDDLSELINKGRSGINWPGYYEWATNKAPGKPLMMCEWGVDLKTNTNPASFFDGDNEAMLAEYPMLKALVFWNSEGVGNYRITETSAKGIALGKAYREFAALPVFNAMSPNAAP